MKKDEFEKLKFALIERAKQSIKDDGYASMMHVFENEVKEVNSKEDRQIMTTYEHDLSLYSSISALLIESTENMREPIFNEKNKLVNYHVLKNPNYELNENIKTTNISIRDLNSFLKKSTVWTIIIAGLTGFFIAMQFFKDDATNRQAINKQLKRQAQILDSIAQAQKGIHSSLSITADSISTLKK